MSNDAEKDLSAFLASLPAYKRKELEQGLSSLTRDEMNQWASACITPVDGIMRDVQLTAEYERLLQLFPARLKEYRKRLMQESQKTLASLLPKGKPGRKPNAALAKRIWALHNAGKTSREIQEILRAEGRNLSTEAVEAYLKTRRRPRPQ